jgi:hypothetical protein
MTGSLTVMRERCCTMSTGRVMCRQVRAETDSVAIQTFFSSLRPRLESLDGSLCVSPSCVWPPPPPPPHTHNVKCFVCLRRDQCGKQSSGQGGVAALIASHDSVKTPYAHTQVDVRKLATVLHAYSLTFDSIILCLVPLPFQKTKHMLPLALDLLYWGRFPSDSRLVPRPARDPRPSGDRHDDFLHSGA